MLITRTSQFSGITRTIDIPCTEEQYRNYVNGQHIQIAMPDVSVEHREFIISGLTQEEWNELFPPEEDEHYMDNNYNE